MQVAPSLKRSIGIGLRAVFAVHGLWFCIAHAGCWSDANLDTMQSDLVRKHFPELKDKSPTVSYCNASEFETNVLGDFNQNSNHIRVLHGSDFPLKIVLAHELGHCLADRHGEEFGKYRGHGRVWIKTMIHAGFKTEAERTAELSFIYPGLDRLYVKTLAEETKGRRRPVNEFDVIAFLKERPSFVDWLFKPID